MSARRNGGVKSSVHSPNGTSSVLPQTSSHQTRSSSSSVSVHQVFVGGPRLVELEHRELGIVLDCSIPSFRKFRLISNTRSKPPTTSRLRYSSGATLRYRSMSSALWCVTNGRALPLRRECSCIIGVSTSSNPRASKEIGASATYDPEARRLKVARVSIVHEQVHVALPASGSRRREHAVRSDRGRRGHDLGCETGLRDAWTDSSPVFVLHHVAAQPTGSRRCRGPCITLERGSSPTSSLRTQT